MTFALVATAQATSVRTFVASTGNDANTASNCPRTAPCRNLSSAFGVTTAGGEIVALDSAGYGTLTINKAVTILGVDGALIAVPANGTGINITAGASDLIIIRNLQITGAGASNTQGIVLSSGKLVLQESSLRMLTTGLIVTNRADITNTDFIGNATAIQTNGAGGGYNGFFFACPCTTLVRINGGNMISNTTVFTENNPTTVMSQATATIYIFQSGTQFSTSITGYTTMMTLTGTGSGSANPGPQTYGGIGAPN